MIDCHIYKLQFDLSANNSKARQEFLKAIEDRCVYFEGGRDPSSDDELKAQIHGKLSALASFDCSSAIMKRAHGAVTWFLRLTPTQNDISELSEIAELLGYYAKASPMNQLGYYAQALQLLAHAAVESASPKDRTYALSLINDAQRVMSMLSKKE